MAKPFNELKRKKFTVTLTEADEDIYNFFVNTKKSSALVRRLLLTYMLRPAEMEALMRGDMSIINKIDIPQSQYEGIQRNYELEAQPIKDSNTKDVFEITEEDEQILEAEAEKEVAITSQKEESQEGDDDRTGYYIKIDNKQETLASLRKILGNKRL